MNSHASLKKVYYVSFFAMVVIPILLVLFISFSVIRLMMQKSALSAIQSAQTAVASHLSDSVKDASLQLSHFVYANDSKVMEIATMTDTEDSKQKYEYSKELDDIFQISMAPKQTVISGMIYMKDGNTTYLKQELAIPREQIITSKWYQEAQSRPNQVCVGSYNTAETDLVMFGGKSRELVLSVAMAPDNQVDKSGKIEMVVLFFRTKIGNLLKKEGGNLTDTILFHPSGEVIFDTEVEGGKAKTFLEELNIKESGVYKQRFLDEGTARKHAYTCVVSDIPETEWKILSCVKTSSLTVGFNRVAGMILAVSSALFLLYFYFSRFFLQNIIQPVHTMVEGLKQVEDGNLDTHIAPAGQYEIRTMIHSFNRMVRQLKTSIHENEVAQEKKLQAEVRALQAQINPHFLVNTLNSIRFMAQVSRFDGIRRMAEALIKIVSCSFRSNNSYYTVREELDMLDSYLYLMKIRYSNGFDVSYEVEESSQEFLMPRLILQPIVENSIVHGFAELDEEMGHLDIRVWKEQETLCLEVQDNGCGMTEEEIAQILGKKHREVDDNYSIGIENVFNRLKLNFKEKCQLKIESERKQYTKTTIRIPIVSKETEKGDENYNESSGDCG